MNLHWVIRSSDKIILIIQALNILSLTFRELYNIIIWFYDDYNILVLLKILCIKTIILFTYKFKTIV